jgi:Protein of unknown function (DUF664)
MSNRHVPSVRLHRAKASTSATQSPPYAVGNQLARSRIVVLDVGHSRGQRVWAHADTTLSPLPLDAAWRVPPWRTASNPATLGRILVLVTAETHQHASHASHADVESAQVDVDVDGAESTQTCSLKLPARVAPPSRAGTSILSWQALATRLGLPVVVRRRGRPLEKLAVPSYFAAQLAPAADLRTRPRTGEGPVRVRLPRPERRPCRLPCLRTRRRRGVDGRRRPSPGRCTQ